MTVRLLIENAYRLMSFQISSGPNWLDSARFDIIAKSDTDVTPDGLLMMLRALLEDRFALRTHREARPEPAYFLTVARDSAKMQQAEGTCIPRDPKNPPARPTSGQQPPNYCGSIRRSRQTLDGIGVQLADTNGITLGTLSGQLSSILGRAVIDKTGLTGIFNFHLQWAAEPSAALAGATNPTPPDTADPSIFTALQEQLGLKLQSGKAPVDILVIDNVEQPSAN